MANFFKVTSKKPAKSAKILTVHINKLDLNGCGVGRYQQKPIFVDNTLPGETVDVRLLEQKNKYFRAKLLKFNNASKHRVAVKCQHFYLCGGCDLQHIHYQEQLAFKQQKIIEHLSRHDISLEVINSLAWQLPISSAPWHYRRKARIGVQFDKNGEATVGFRQKSTNQLVAIKSCPVLMKPATDIFPLLKGVIDQLSVKKSIGHIEVICADVNEKPDQVILVIRQLRALNKHDEQLWHEHAQKHQWQLVFNEGKSNEGKSEEGKHDQCQAVGNTSKDIFIDTPHNRFSYPLIDDISINFAEHDFIQINSQVNIAMVTQAMSWLMLNSEDCVLDLFCGLGNFSLPMAKKVKMVIGVEGVQAMVDKACINAEINHIDNCKFYQADLNSDWLTQPWAKNKFSVALFDPARAGAEQAIMQVATLAIATILYVSCAPATLARDSQILLSHGYKMVKIGLVDMFSQTKHVETMVLFHRQL